MMRHLQSLRERIAQAPTNRRGYRQYARKLRRDIEEHAASRVDQGASYKQIAGELGLADATLQNWCKDCPPKQMPESRPMGFRLVEVVEGRVEKGENSALEIELSYGEIKTDMLNSTPLRSKSVDRIRQEIWGILIAYNLVRLEMARVADEANVTPTRISFVMVYRMICDEWQWCALASPGAIPRHLRNLRANVASFILPPRRPERSYPRAVKVKMSNYPRKRRVGNAA